MVREVLVVGITPLLCRVWGWHEFNAVAGAVRWCVCVMSSGW